MDLTSLSATAMRALLDDGQVRSVDLVRAHLDRIDQRDRTLRAFTAVFHDEALAAAARADEERARPGRDPRRSLLHGLPVTVKESVDMAGLASTMGVPSRLSHRATSDGGMVKALRDAGAIVLGRTNVAQYLMSHESHNPIFGQCNNPWSLAHTPGGSSGGEAAAIAAGLSPLGVGTDIGGSIRCPAHFAGVVGLKPTLDRWSNRGSNTALLGQEAIRGQIGPMARTVDDVILLMRGLDYERMSFDDPRVPPLPAPDPSDVDLTGLRVGHYVEDGLLRTSTAVARAVDRARRALEDQGAHLVPFTPPRIPEHIFLYFAAMSADGSGIIHKGLEGGEVDPILTGIMRLNRMPTQLRLGLAKVARTLGEEHAARLLEAAGAKSAEAFWGITAQLRAYRFEVQAAMEAASVDAVLCPPFATPALPHLAGREFALAGSHCMLWNVLQFPAGIVPVTRVRPDETTRVGGKGRFEKRAAEVDAASAGLPVGVQIVTRPWREDLALALMRAVERGVRDDDGWPKTPV